MIGRIWGTGSCVPQRTMDNNDLARIVDTSDEWIRERTGVVRRHIIEEETTVSMAVQAAERAIENSGIPAEEIDLILFATSSSNVIMPCAACEVQQAVGAVNATCFDLNAACTGFVLAFNTAQAYMAAGMCRTALVIGAESLSNLVDWTDRSTCVLFGDGAGAAVVRAEEEGLFRGAAHSEGIKGKALTCLSRHRKDWDRSQDDKDTYIRMDGQDVFKFAVRKVPEIIEELLEAQGVDLEEIDLFLLHQANRRIVEAAAKRLKADIRKFPMNMDEYGNTSAASIPILLDELNRKGMLQRGQKIIMAGFGAGLTWAASLIQW